MVLVGSNLELENWKLFLAVMKSLSFLKQRKGLILLACVLILLVLFLYPSIPEDRDSSQCPQDMGKGKQTPLVLDTALVNTYLEEVLVNTSGCKLFGLNPFSPQVERFWCNFTRPKCPQPVVVLRYQVGCNNCPCPNPKCPCPCPSLSLSLDPPNSKL